MMFNFLACILLQQIFALDIHLAPLSESDQSQLDASSVQLGKFYFEPFMPEPSTATTCEACTLTPEDDPGTGVPCYSCSGAVPLDVSSDGTITFNWRPANDYSKSLKIHGTGLAKIELRFQFSLDCDAGIAYQRMEGADLTIEFDFVDDVSLQKYNVVLDESKITIGYDSMVQHCVVYTGVEIASDAGELYLHFLKMSVSATYSGTGMITGANDYTWNTFETTSLEPQGLPSATIAYETPDYVGWVKGSWGACDQTCGDGTQTRTVECSTSLTSCVEADKPATTQTCNVATCPEPVDCAGSWSACTSACESASDRTWTETTAQAGTGAACPDAVDCAPGVDACPAAGSSANAINCFLWITLSLVAVLF